MTIFCIYLEAVKFALAYILQNYQQMAGAIVYICFNGLHDVLFLFLPLQMAAVRIKETRERNSVSAALLWLTPRRDIKNRQTNIA